MGFLQCANVSEVALANFSKMTPFKRQFYFHCLVRHIEAVGALDIYRCVDGKWSGWRHQPLTQIAEWVGEFDRHYARQQFILLAGYPLLSSTARAKHE
jgi:hypothetical protein